MAENYLVNIRQINEQFFSNRSSMEILTVLRISNDWRAKETTNEPHSDSVARRHNFSKSRGKQQVKKIISKHSFWFLLLALSALSVSASESFAAQLQLSWTDNSTNETGFKIDRKTGTSGTYAQIASVGAGITSYTDSTVTAGTNYCYRL